MVGAEEGGVAQRLCGTRDSELIGVGGTLLGFDEDAEIHDASVEGESGSSLWRYGHCQGSLTACISAAPGTKADRRGIGCVVTLMVPSTVIVR